MKGDKIGATSTPLSKSSVLKEHQQNNNKKENVRRKSMKENSEKQKKLPVTQSRKSLPNVVSKENISEKPKNFRPPHQRLEDKRGLQRRQQALEAMQILEQRRQRLTQPSLEVKMEEMTLKPKRESRDQLEEKKRLEAKRSKEKRILAHLAEQEALKKKKAARKPRLGSSKSYPSIRQEFKHSPSNFRPRFQVAYKPTFVHFEKPQEDVKADVEPSKKFIKYSKDELRSLNPYGYYFM